MNWFKRDSPEVKAEKKAEKIRRLREQVAGLDFEKQNRIAGVLLLWLHPLVHLGKVTNLTINDIPPAPKMVLSSYTRPIFYEKWNNAIEKVQRKNHQVIQENFQKKLEAYQTYRSATVMGKTIGPNAPKRVPRPRELPSRLQQSIPFTVTSVEELRSLPTPKPFNHDPTTTTSASAHLLLNHLSSHPAVSVLDEFYEKDKLPVDLPTEGTQSSDENNNPDDDIENHQQTKFSRASSRKSKSVKVEDDLADLGSVPENGADKKAKPVLTTAPSTSPPTTQAPSDAELAYTINGETNSFSETKQPEVVGTWVIMDAWKKPVIQAFIVEIFFVTMNLLQPTGVKQLANYFTRYRADSSSVSTLEGIWYALILTLITVCTVSSVLLKIHNMMNWSARSSSSYLMAIFHKLLRAAPYSLNNDKALSAGTVINLTSQDAGVPFNVMIHVLHVVSGPLMLIAALILLYLDDFGSSALITMVMMLLLIPYQFVIAKFRHWLRGKWLKATDERLQKTISILSGLRVAKIYSWESKLQDQIQELRNKELRTLRNSALLQVLSDIFMQVYPLIVTFATISHFVSRQADKFTSAQIVVLLSYLNAMRLPIQFLGVAMQSMIELYLSGARVGHFLSKEELPVHQSRLEHALLQAQIDATMKQYRQEDSQQQSNQKAKNNGQYAQFQDEEDHLDNISTTSSYHSATNSSTPNADPFNTPFVGVNGTGQGKKNANSPLIKLQNVDFYWSSFEQTPHQTPVLSNISLELKRGEILGLISPSGMGKSALLQGLFGELYPQPSHSHEGLTSIANISTQSSSSSPNTEPQMIDGIYSFNNRIEVIPDDLVQLNGRVAYCAQTPWIMNDTVRNNIIMNLPFDSVKFQQVIAASSLQPDLEIFPDGDYTLVSEQGVSLSGGQQARVQFARVLYAAISDAVEICIIDDIFAAVDAYVARNMFFRGVVGIIQPRCGVVMALNSHYEYLHQCTRTLMLDHSTDTYWLVLHQYILTKQSHLINKALAKKVLEQENGDLQRSVSLLSRGSSNADASDLMISDSTLGALSGSQSYIASNNGPGITKAHSFGHTLSPPTSTHNNNNLHQTPLSSHPPTNQPISPAVVYANNHQGIPEAFLDPTQLHGFRQPSTISFSGSLDELIPLNLPLLSNFVQAAMTGEDQAMIDSANDIPLDMNLEGDVKKGTIGQQDDEKEKKQQDKLGHKIEGMELNSKKQGGPNTAPSTSGGPSQAKLPSWLYLYWFQGSRGKLGLWLVFASFVVVSLISQLFRTGSDVWLVWWADDEGRGLERHYSRNWWLTTTGLGMVFTFIFFVVQILIYLYVWLDASRYIHRTAIGRVFKATIQYLDVTPMGQILNKVGGKDLEILDLQLPDNLLFLVQQCLVLSGILVLSFFTTWLFIIPLIPFALALSYLREGYHKSSIQVKRIESGTLSPIYSLFGSVVRGTSVIRAFRLENVFLDKYRGLVDKYMQMKIIATQLERRFAFGLNILASVYIFLVTTTVVFARDYVDTSMGMLSIVYSLRLIGLLQMTIRFYTSATQCMTAIQRIESLSTIPLERSANTAPEVKELLYQKTPAEVKKLLITAANSNNPGVSTRQYKHLADHFFFPWFGKVEFKNISLRYRPDLPLVLNNLSFTIEPGDTVGVLGRTGSGKSTLIQSLFSILLPESGTIEIDGVDISTLGISDLRSRIALVPQTPTCFAGSIRNNLDPMGRMTDADLYTVLDWVHLTNKINQLGNGLDSQLDDHGGNLSASERQLLCIGRALLTQFRNNLPQELTPLTGSILVTDEATSSIPNDELINDTIDTAFNSSTRIVIAHRLHTVITCTKILILRPLTPEDIASGMTSLVEYDTPWLLLNKENSEFKRMCFSAGEEMFASLYKMAKESYFKRILPQQASNLASQSFNNTSGSARNSGVSNSQNLLPVPIQLPIFPSTAEPLPAQLQVNAIPTMSKTNSSNPSTPKGSKEKENLFVISPATPITTITPSPSTLSREQRLDSTQSSLQRAISNVGAALQLNFDDEQNNDQLQQVENSLLSPRDPFAPTYFDGSNDTRDAMFRHHNNNNVDQSIEQYNTNYDGTYDKNYNHDQMDKEQHPNLIFSEDNQTPHDPYFLGYMMTKQDDGVNNNDQQNGSDDNDDEIDPNNVLYG